MYPVHLMTCSALCGRRSLLCGCATGQSPSKVMAVDHHSRDTSGMRNGNRRRVSHVQAHSRLRGADSQVGRFAGTGKEQAAATIPRAAGADDGLVAPKPRAASTRTSSLPSLSSPPPAQTAPVTDPTNAHSCRRGRRRKRRRSRQVEPSINPRCSPTHHPHTHHAFCRQTGPAGAGRVAHRQLWLSRPLSVDVGHP